jgi:CMD domain protein
MPHLPDIIDQLTGTSPGSPLDQIRRQRPDARENAQASFQAIFDPRPGSGTSQLERETLGAFVTGVGQDPDIAALYWGRFSALQGSESLAGSLAAVIAAGVTTGPFGRYPENTNLTDENTDGLRLVVTAEHRARLGIRLAAAIEHAHLLVFRPRESSAAALQALLDAGWTTDDIVTLSQLVSFLAFQHRVVVGLRLLGASISPGIGASFTTDELENESAEGAFA